MLIRPRGLIAGLVACVLFVAGLVAVVTVRSSRAGAVTATPVIGRLTLGHSVQGRPIVAYHLGDPRIRRVSVLLGQLHGDEHAGVTLARSLINGSRAVEGINLWVIPTMNPDGDAHHTRQNAHGVDLNRNWPNNWAHLTGKYYSGPEPWSEPETQAVAKFLWWLKPNYLVVLHQPLYGVDTTDGASLDPRFRDALSHNLGLPEKAFLCGSVCHGSLTGWYTAHKWGVDETIEFGSSPSSSYLTGQARDGILSAMGAHWGALAAHDPLRYLQVTPDKHGFTASGWTFDPDQPGVSQEYTIYIDGVSHGTHRTTVENTVINQRYHIGGEHGYAFAEAERPGTHHVCLVYKNVMAGTGDPRSCRDIEVGGAAA